MAPELHHGKLTAIAKTMVTESCWNEIITRARKAKCSESDLLRELIFLGVSGHTYSELVAKDRRAQLGIQDAQEYEGSTQ